MNDSEDTQGRTRTTEQIAAAGADSEDRTGTGQQPLQDAQPDQPAPARHAAVSSDPGTGDHPHAQLLEDHELQDMLVQWKDIQAEFVDEPRKASRTRMPSSPSSCSA